MTTVTITFNSELQGLSDNKHTNKQHRTWPMAGTKELLVKIAGLYLSSLVVKIEDF